MIQKVFRSLCQVLALSLSLGVLPYSAPVLAQSTETALYKQIKALQGVQEVKALKFQQPFSEKYLVRIKQWLDPSDTTAGSFTQRVFISHYGFDAPTVFVTEGYTGDYAGMAAYTEELTELFSTNQILVEHRFFGESMPSPLNWKYLTTTNAAADHHRIAKAFKQVYKGKWIATGISKGGQTALIYRTLYPDDVDISVCYVAPLCFGVEDGRHEPFICCSVADEVSRAKIKAFQLEVLKRRNKIFPLFKAYCEDNHYSFRLPLQEIYDYTVFEFSFSFWQWGWKTGSIPSDQASDSDLFNYLVRVCSPDYFAIEGMEGHKAFYVQAAKELGYYGYETEPFAKVKSAKNYLQNIFLGPEMQFEFDATMARRCERFLQENDPTMIFVYGQYDPWSAAAVQFTGKTNMYRAVAKGGSHASRIENLDEAQKKEVVERIRKWLL
jgi:hypothetical protein